MKKQKKVLNMQRRRKEQPPVPQENGPEPSTPDFNDAQMAEFMAKAEAAFASNGSQTRYFVHDPMGLLSQQEPDGTWRFPIQDGLSSIRGVTDEALSILESREYDPFGNLVSTQGMPQTPFGFAGEMTDPNGLVYLRNRYYNPALGVFPSPDPISGNVQQPMSLNPYTYAQNNPVNWVDPSGMVTLPSQFTSCTGFDNNQFPTPPGWYCPAYVPEKARDYALEWATKYNPAYCNHDLDTCGGEKTSDCANFVSQALYTGKHPMAWPGGLAKLDLHDTVLRDIYWAVECHTTNCESTKAWSVGSTLAEYLKTLPGREVVPLSPIANFQEESVRTMIETHLQELKTSKVRSGDVLYLPDSTPRHVAMVVGWGEAVTRPEDIPENPYLVDEYTDTLFGGMIVPYVVDHGLQNSKGRPYYALRWGPGNFAAGTQWEFIRIPPVTCVEQDDYIR